MNFDYLDFLAWMDLITYPTTLANDLMELGLDLPTAVYYKMEWTTLNKETDKFHIIRLYQNYCVNVPELDESHVGFYIKKHLELMYTKWTNLK